MKEFVNKLVRINDIYFCDFVVVGESFLNLSFCEKIASHHYLQDKKCHHRCEEHHKESFLDSYEVDLETVILHEVFDS